MVDGTDVTAGISPHGLIKIILTALISVIIGAVLRGNNPVNEFSRQVVGKVAERAIDDVLVPRSRVSDSPPPERAASIGLGSRQLPSSETSRALPQLLSSVQRGSSDFDLDEQLKDVTSYSSLQIREETQYVLFAGTEYFLNAPLGYSVQYRILSGYALQNRDGKFFRRCRSSSFTTYAEVSVFSLVPCSPKVVIAVDYVVVGDLIGDKPYSRNPQY